MKFNVLCVSDFRNDRFRMPISGQAEMQNDVITFQGKTFKVTGRGVDLTGNVRAFLCEPIEEPTLPPTVDSLYFRRVDLVYLPELKFYSDIPAESERAEKCLASAREELAQKRESEEVILPSEKHRWWLKSERFWGPSW